MSIRRCLFAAVAGVLLAGNSAQAAFHVMQIEQVIGGINGNPAAQAIQLRMRGAGQNLVSNSRMYAADAAGLNRVLLLDLAANVTNSAAGARVLLATSAFTTYMVSNGNGSFTPDFTLASAIPASYLAAGRLTFEDDGGSTSTPGTIYWSLCWGGAGYTGTNTGSTQNDADGNFGTAFASALPTASRQGVRFPGTAAAASTTNAADYALSADPATVVRNSGTSFTIPAIPGDYNGDTLVNAADYTSWRQTFGTAVTASTAADGDGSGAIDAGDYVKWRANPAIASIVAAANVPEPAAIALVLSAILATQLRRRLTPSPFGRGQG